MVLKGLVLLCGLSLLVVAEHAENALLAQPIDVSLVSRSTAELQGMECFSLGECEQCLKNTRCGWCADAELCYEGGTTGPACGSAITTPCTLWIHKDAAPAGMLGGMCGLSQMQNVFAEAKRNTPRPLN